MLRTALRATAIAAAALVVIVLAGRPSSSQQAAEPADPRIEKFKAAVAEGVAAAAQARASHQRHRLQLRRARLPGDRDLEVPDRCAGEERLHDRARLCRHADRLGGALGLRQAGDRARQRHRLPAEDLAEARRRLSRAAGRGRARPWRGPQLRPGGQHRRGARREGPDGARKASRHAHALAGRRRGTARRQGLLRARRHVQGCRRRAVHPRRRQSRHHLGPAARQRPGLGRVHVRGRIGARRVRALARPQRAARGRADEHRLGFPPRASAPRAALALRHHQRRRSAQRGAVGRLGLVLLPRDRFREHQEELRDRQQDRAKRPR